MTFRLRPYRQQDAADALRLSNMASGHQATLDRFLAQEAEKDVWRQLAEQGGRTAGMTELRSFDYLPPNWLLLTVAVDPEARGNGLGTGLLHQALHHARVAGAVGVAANVLDHDPRSREWAERHGFVLHAHRFASELDLRLEQAPPDLPAGVTIRDMTSATPAEWERLEVLYGDLLTQTPDLAGQPRWTTEHLQSHVRDNPRLRPDWQLVAVNADGEWLGLCQGLPISTGMYNEFTAVVAQARGRGIARALKLELIRRAREANIALMRTNNHSANAPMLSVNRRLGFVAKTGNWELWRSLEMPVPL